MKNLRIAFVLGTRPEILKLASVIREANKLGIECTVVHTGQHYDHNMSAVFFEDLGLPEPDVFIGVGSGSHGDQTGKGLMEVERYLKESKPDVVAVVGDTNAGVSGALAACKLGIPVAHFEAGARSYDWTMPEEINRRLLDSISRFCFAPTQLCLKRLQYEGRKEDSWYVGDTLVETAMDIAGRLGSSEALFTKFGLKNGEFCLLTIHRADNVDDTERLRSILTALNSLEYPVLFPVHPRTKKKIHDANLSSCVSRIIMADPLPYTSFMKLIRASRFVVTDSGGVQQEAAIFEKPSLTLRDNTEWMETIFSGGNKLVHAEIGELKREALAIINSDLENKLVNPFELGASAKALKILLEAWKKSELSYRVSNFFEHDYDRHL